MVNRIGMVYPSGIDGVGSVRDSVWTSEFDMKHWKRTGERIGRGVVIIAIGMRYVVQIF